MPALGVGVDSHGGQQHQAVDSDDDNDQERNAGNLFDQGRFPGTVIANQGHNFPGTGLEVNFGEDLHSAKVQGRV